MAWYITRTYGATTRRYNLRLVQTAPDRQTLPNTSIGMPGGDATKNICIAIQGMENTLDVTFIMTDNGTDKSNGTHGTPVVSLLEQIDYLKNVIHYPAIGTTWKLYNDVYTSGLEVVLEEIFIDWAASSPRGIPVTLRMKVGQVR
ncbi:MAG: hypothetical protein PHZ19_02030 [Candidatus Thermoplasmatota archaeon]|nr:hypothetical protein [Candidatus Thermoplasmatota archaeon]